MPLSPPRPATHLVVLDVDGEAVVYDPRTHRAHLLNTTAATIWHCLADGLTTTQIADTVAAAYEVPVREVRAHVQRLVAEFTSIGLASDPTAPTPASDPHEPDTADEADRLARRYGITSDTPRVQARPEGAWDHCTPTFDALGLRFAIVADAPEVVAYIGRALHALRADGAASFWYAVRTKTPSGRIELSIGGSEPIAGSHPLSAIVGRILWDYNHRAIMWADAPILLHAAGVASPAGVVALPAPAESGKSTLATALVTHGYGYVTDECVAIEPRQQGQHEVTAYPKPIGLDPGSWPLFPDLIDDDPIQPVKRWISGADIGAAVRAPHPPSGASLPLAAIVFPRYEPDSLGTLEPVSPAECLVGLARNTFRLADAPQARMADLLAVAERTPAYRLAVDDLGRACVEIDRLVADLA